MIKLFDNESIKQLQEALEQFSKVSERIQNLFESQKGAFANFAQGLKRVAEELPEAVIELSKLGWYTLLMSELKLPIQLKDELDAGNIDAVDDLMMEYLDQIYGIYKKDVLKTFQIRKLPLEAGFSAHERGEYFLSVPVFLAQIEGMCFDQINERYFSIRKGEPKTKKWVEENKRSEVMTILLEPLKLIGPFREVQDFNNPIGINRHDVLHGQSVDYGTKVNGYKVLSLLFYVSEIKKVK